MAFVVNPDGSAKDPVAFRDALRGDSAKMAALEKEPAAYAVVMGDDIDALQTLLRETYQKEKPRIEARRQLRSRRTIEAQRAAAPVPKDTVELYKRMHEIGLQYGPAFRLLRNVHVPDAHA